MPKNIFKNVAANTKQFVSEHRVAIAVVAAATVTTTVMVAIAREAKEQRDEFLAEHNLLETFYAQFDDEA
jgi:aspartokinase